MQLVPRPQPFLPSSPKRVGEFELFLRNLGLMLLLVAPSFQLPRGCQRFCSSAVEAFSVTWRLWLEAEDKALRGRNLSAVFRTLYRQAGEPFQRLPSCAQAWRVENPCNKSTVRTARRLRMGRDSTEQNSAATRPVTRGRAACRVGSLSRDIPLRPNHKPAL